MFATIDFSHMAPEQLAQIPAGVPPLGVVPNLVNPPTVGYNIVIAGSILMAIMLTVVAMRFYVVFRLKKKMGGDDWTVVAGVIGSCYYFAVLCLAVTKAKFGTHMYNLSVAHMRRKEVALLIWYNQVGLHV
ncbi:hypothetical protein DM02DRAFT_624609 [Periconia macrospinosa]|uniref:Chitin synthase export chaperone n=1 Tax=Periconia macrospinosa TaxID=97972 RepID=A0A2V1E2R2_9PLEO|nr:hypothetical protein DM02DRAFT_624609 [Periconia macrospinosa]